MTFSPPQNAIGELQRCITRMSSGVGNPLTSVDTNIGVHGYSADVAQQILAQGREKYASQPDILNTS